MHAASGMGSQCFWHMAVKEETGVSVAVEEGMRMKAEVEEGAGIGTDWRV